MGNPVMGLIFTGVLIRKKGILTIHQLGKDALARTLLGDGRHQAKHKYIKYIPVKTAIFIAVEADRIQDYNQGI